MESEKRGAAPAILSPDKETLSYRSLAEHLQTTALQFSRWGIRPGDRLAVVLPNGPELATSFLAVSSICTCAPLNPAYGLEEFIFSFNDLKIKALLTDRGKEHPACIAAAQVGIPIISLIPDAQSSGIFRVECGLPNDETISSSILAKTSDEALVLHTSGTTARPKIVSLTHANIYHSVHNITGTYKLSEIDRCLNMMPLFHVHGLMAALGASLSSGGSVICSPGFSPEKIFKWLIEMKPTWYTAVPTIHQAILEQAHKTPPISDEIHLRFIRSCSSPLAPQTARDLEDIFRVPVLEAYGMTEATHQISSNPLPPQLRKFGSVGMATGGTRVTILNDKGGALPQNTVGEICIRGENVIQGYQNNPSANETSIANGWLRTGDQGYLDNEGYLFIQSRLKELINRGGEKISPREVDEALLRHPAVRQAVTFAIPHPSLGEDVAAAVVLKNEQSVSMRDLQQFIAAKLAYFKVPRYIIPMEEIPKGPTGKIQRIGLAEKLKRELEAAKLRNRGEIIAPASPVEEEILKIWKEVLGLQELGVNDDFLELGGDSIKAAQILNRVNEQFTINLQLNDIFMVSTIAMMAEVVRAKSDRIE